MRKKERREGQGLLANWFLELFLSSGVTESRRVKREIKGGRRLSGRYLEPPNSQVNMGMK